MRNSNNFLTHIARKNDNYAGKIEFYQARLSNAVDNLNMDNIKFYASKLEYFVNRQVACSAKLDNEWANESI